MEYETRILAIFTFFAVFQFNITSCQPFPEKNIGQGQENDLRIMLKTVMEQNRRLTSQNNRLQQVWLGMQQMCKAISESTCECGQGQGQGQTNVFPATLPSPSPGPVTSQTTFQQKTHVLPLQVMSIKSDGDNVDPTPISITYAATPDHTTEWVGFRRNGAMWTTAGQRVQDYNDSSVYTSTVEVSQLGNVSDMRFRLYNDDENVYILLNISEIMTRQEQDVIPPDDDLLKISTSVIAHRDTDLNIIGIIKKSYQEFIRHGSIEFFFAGLNTSASPPAAFEINDYESEGFDIRGDPRTDTTTTIDITVGYSYVQYGGILNVRMSYQDSMTGMVEKLYYGPFIKVYSPDGYVVQNNTIGIFPLAGQTILLPPSQSVICAAMGNPRPEVSFLKMAKDGQNVKMATETVILDTYINMKVLTMSTNRPKQTEGQYICRATHGNQTVDSLTEVIVFEPAVFDDAKTGVTKNESQSVVISCKARGKPKPHLHLRHGQYGEEITNSGMYKIWSSNSTKFTSRVTLTISTVDGQTIHSVYCVAAQSSPTLWHEVNRRINIFPGKEEID